jgi:cytoskeletal protein CcmA (bactofilin family)
MVFRRDSKAGDSFQRQISALRQQLGGEAPVEERRDEPEAERQTAERSPGFENFGRSSAPGTDFGGRGFGFSAYDSEAQGTTPAGEEPGVPESPAIPPIDADTTVIARNATWKGELSSEGAVHIHGHFEGTVRARTDIFVAEEAEVDATLTAERVVVAGTVKGSIRSGARFEALPTGRITGDVQTPTIVVHEGAIINGQFRMGVAEAAESAEATKPASVIQRRQARGTA